MKFRTAYDLARDKFRDQDRRLRRVVLPRPVPVRESVARRPADEVPFTPPAVTILAPKPETAADIRRFVLEEFAEAKRKRDIRGSR